MNSKRSLVQLLCPRDIAMRGWFFVRAGPGWRLALTLILTGALGAGCKRDNAVPSATVKTTSRDVPTAGTRQTEYDALEKDPRAGKLEEISSRFVRTGTVTTDDVDLLFALSAAYPGEAKVSDLLERILVRRKDWDALVRFCNTKPLNERSAEENLRLAKMLIMAQRFDEALPSLESLIAEVPDNVEYQWLHGYADYFRGDYAGAIETFEQFGPQLIAGGRDESLLLCGLSHFQLGQMDKALELLTNYNRREPNDLSGCNSLARVLFAVGRKDEAQSLLDRVTQLHEQQNAVEKKQILFATKIRELNRAWSERRLGDCESIIQDVLPMTDGEMRYRLQLKLAEVYAATGRDEAADQARQDAAVSRSKGKGNE